MTHLVPALGLGSHRIVAIAGAGGKTSLLYALARELAGAGERVLLTTTTRLLPPPRGTVDALVLAGDPDQLAAWAKDAFEAGARVVLAAAGEVRDGDETKLAGLAPDAVAPVLAGSRADRVLVEADGAKHRPLKWPRAGEPVWPGATSLAIAVAGLHGLADPLGDDGFFRLDLAGAEAGLRPGHRVTPGLVVRLLARTLRDAPARAARAVVLNRHGAGADSPAALAGRAIAWRWRHGGFPGPAVPVDLAGDSPLVDLREARIGAVLLAAGGSTRLGRPKQVLEWHGETLVRRVARTAREWGVDPLVVVTGAAGAAVTSQVADLADVVVANPAWDQGQATSVRAGLGALPPDVDAAFFLLADQPLLRGADLELLARSWAGSLAAAVVPHYDDGSGGWRPGSPVLFGLARSRLLLERVEGDRGGRAILASLGDDVLAVAMPRTASGLDIDTAGDLERLAALEERP